MTLMSSDLQSDSDLDSIRNSCDVFYKTSALPSCAHALWSTSTGIFTKLSNYDSGNFLKMTMWVISHIFDQFWNSNHGVMTKMKVTWRTESDTGQPLQCLPLKSILQTPRKQSEKNIGCHWHFERHSWRSEQDKLNVTDGSVLVSSYCWADP